MSTPPTIIVKHQNTPSPTSTCCGLFCCSWLVIVIAGAALNTLGQLL